MEIRRYKAGEENAIWNIVFCATRQSIARDYHPDLIDRWAPHDKDMEEWATRIAQQNPFVAIVDAIPVGMAELEDTGFIDYFYVHPEFQGVGVGKALLTAIEDEAGRLGVCRIYADVSVTAEPFFSSRGFTVVESRSNTILGHSAPNFAMSKDINSEPWQIDPHQPPCQRSLPKIEPQHPSRRSAPLVRPSALGRSARIQMKKLPLAIALLLLISATGMILIKRSGCGLDGLPPNDFPTSALDPTPLSLRADSFAALTRTRTRPRRPALEDSLPPGSRVIEPKRFLSGIEVILSDGSHISAADASATANGTCFEGPYRFTLANRIMWTGADGSTLFLARDGSSYKTFGPPGGGESTGLYTPGKMIGPSGPGGTYTPDKIVEAQVQE